MSAQTGEVDISYYRKPTGDQLKSLDAIEGMHTQKSLVGYNIFFSFDLLRQQRPFSRISAYVRQWCGPLTGTRSSMTC